MSNEERTLEHREIRGITLKNITVTIISTISIVVSVMGTYFQLKGDIRDVKNQNETQNKVTDIRLNVLESQVVILRAEVEALKNQQLKH